MLFSTWQFILIFLPITWGLYFWFNHKRLILAGKVVLVFASLFFYAYWDVRYLPLILISILFNFGIGTALTRLYPKDSVLHEDSNRRYYRILFLSLGIGANLLLLGYYKYSHFFISNLNTHFATSYNIPSIVLPLAISFFTFTQIVYLVDSFRGQTGKYDLLNYSLFVTFFPHLIAGPIVQHQQIMPQFYSRWTLSWRASNVLRGLLIFSIGFFKKVVIADTFAIYSDAGFDGNGPIDFFTAWATSLSYTFQLYFDFSGYCDMAMGAALLFNIWLPINFNSPYRALSIQDFWRRWHITLSHFLRDYLYIPMGGNRYSKYRTYITLFITFVLGGLWHGASWMFVLWGALHGLGLVVHRIWQQLHLPLPKPIAWLVTFAFVNVTWVFFRAKTGEDALRILHGMVDIQSIYQPLIGAKSILNISWSGWLGDLLLHLFPSSLVSQLPIYLAITFGFILIFQKNSVAVIQGRITTAKVLICALLFSAALLVSLTQTSSVFLYFNF